MTILSETTIDRFELVSHEDFLNSQNLAEPVFALAMKKMSERNIHISRTFDPLGKQQYKEIITYVEESVLSDPQ